MHARDATPFRGCGDLRPQVEHVSNESYIASWHKVLEDDKRAVFAAASRAQKAAARQRRLRSYSSVTDFTISPLSTVVPSRATVALPV